MGKCGRSQDRGFACLRSLLSHGAEVIALQECENLDTYTNAINQLGWTLVSSSCRKAAIAFRGRACHNIVRSFTQFSRLAIVVLRRPSLLLVSAYFPYVGMRGGTEITMRMLKNIDTIYKQCKEQYRYECELMVAGDFNVELSPDITTPSGTVTGGAVQIHQGRGYGNDSEDRRWEEEFQRTELEGWMCVVCRC